MWKAMKSRTYQTQSGETRHSNDINVSEIQFLEQCSDSGGQGPVPEQYQETEEDPELPF